MRIIIEGAPDQWILGENCSEHLLLQQCRNIVALVPDVPRELDVLVVVANNAEERQPKVSHSGRQGPRVLLHVTRNQLVDLRRSSRRVMVTKRSLPRSFKGQREPTVQKRMSKADGSEFLDRNFFRAIQCNRRCSGCSKRLISL